MFGHFKISSQLLFKQISDLSNKTVRISKPKNLPVQKMKGKLLQVVGLNKFQANVLIPVQNVTKHLNQNEN